MKIELEFPGGAAVDARFRDHLVRSDQTAAGGGRDAAPAPFDLFLASLATCAGFYALRFCTSRGLDTAGLGLTLEPVRDPDTRRLTRLEMVLTPPLGFPRKYERAILRAVDQCAVKKVLLDPPEIAVRLVSVPVPDVLEAVPTSD